jgi:soluble lytic murein transglycosylase-like protein
MRTPYRSMITPVANAFSLDPNLVEAIVLVESSGRADAFRFEPKYWDRYLAKLPEYKDAIPRRVSSSYGLMQIMFRTAWECGFRGEPEMLFVPRENLHWGCRYLHTQRQWADSFTAASPQQRRLAWLASYNGGRGGNEPGSALRPVNKAYALRVLSTVKDLDLTTT